MKKRKQIRNAKRLLTVLLCLAQLMSIASGAVAAEAASSAVYNSATDMYEKYRVTGESGGQQTIEALRFNLFDEGSGENVRSVRSAQAYNASMQALLEDTALGHINGSKDVFFASEEDAKEGIIKVVLDMVAKPDNPPPVDVIFVLDRSGSMNLYHTSKGVSSSNHPCLNADHYYEIPVRLSGGTKTVKVYPTGNPVIVYPEAGTTQNKTTQQWTGVRSEVLPAGSNLKFPMQAPSYGGDWWPIIRKEIAKHYGVEESAVDNYGSFAKKHYENGVEVDYTYEDSQTAYDAYATVGSGGTLTYTDGNYFSPPIEDGLHDCLDRSIIARRQMKSFAQNVINATSKQTDPSKKNRVGYVAFDTNVASANVVPLTNNINDLERIWTDHGGGNQTNYAAGLSNALNMLVNAQDGAANQTAYDMENRRTYVVMLSDGYAQTGAAPGKTLEETVTDYANEIDRRKNTVVYGVGIHSGESDHLKKWVASGGDKAGGSNGDFPAADAGGKFNPAGGEYFRNCMSEKEIREFLEIIERQVLTMTGTLQDVSGSAATVGGDEAAFKIIMDADHPMEFFEGSAATSGDTYERYESFKTEYGHGITLESDKTAVNWTYGPDESGARLSFYMQLQPKYIALDTGVTENYLTNDADKSKIVYSPVNQGTVGKEQTIPLGCPAEIRVQTAKLTVTKANDPAENKTYVLPGDKITYTFTATVSEDSAFGFDDVQVQDILPDGVEHSGTNTLIIGDVTKNTPVTQFLTVTVKDSGSLVNYGKFSTPSAPGMTAETNRVNNLRATTASFPVVKILEAAEGLTAPDITGKFTFTLTANGAPMPAVTSYTNPAADGGKVTFGAIEFRAPGTYTYTVTETGAVDGVENDTQAAKTVTVTVTKNGNGDLVAAVSATDNAPVTFTNTYKVDSTKVSFPVVKILEAEEGLNVPDITGKYTFELTAAEGVPMPEVLSYTNPNVDGGKVTFGAIEYTKPGTYTYTVTETGTVPGIENDAEAAKTVTVTVVDNGDGTMTATATATEETPLQFTNTYKVGSAAVSFPVIKILEADDGLNVPDISGKFTFELTAADGTPMPEVTSYTNPDKDGGKVTFGAIEYTKPGTYTYTVTETGAVDGVTNDAEAAKTVTVKVEDNGDGTLTATADYTEETPLQFTNVYGVSPVTAQFVGSKELTGRTLKEGEFRFQLTAVTEGAPMPSKDIVSNTADGEGGFTKVEFGMITYAKPGTYEYKIVELNDGLPGITYDATEKTVTVTVTDGSNGVLTATGESDALIWNNAYTPDDAEAVLAVQKLVNGAVPADEFTGSFTFTLTPVGEVPMPESSTAVNGEGGLVQFGKILYNQTGVYRYAITESVIEPAINGMFRDEKTIYAQVTVTYDEDQGVFLTETAYSLGEDAAEDVQIAFDNEYAPPKLQDMAVSKRCAVYGHEQLHDVASQVPWVYLGDEIPYVIRVTNNSRADMRDIVISDKVPQHTEYVPGSGGELDENNTVWFKIEKLGPGESAEVGFTVKTLVDDVFIHNTAYVGTPDIEGTLTPDGEPKVATNEVIDQVLPLPDIANTGDASNLVLCAAVLAASVGGVMLMRKRRK